MHLVGFGGLAVLAMTVSAGAQEVGSWRPADCASLEAKSLEAAVLDCDPASLLRSRETATGTATSDPAASWRDASGDDPPPEPLAPDDDPPAIAISSKSW